jgi:hypothetical protein
MTIHSKNIFLKEDIIRWFLMQLSFCKTEHTFDERMRTNGRTNIRLNANISVCAAQTA